MADWYPWSELAIEPTTDRNAIMKAYAVLLKATRPDENPAGFQALKEARDFALALAERQAAQMAVHAEAPSFEDGSEADADMLMMGADALQAALRMDAALGQEGTDTNGQGELGEDGPSVVELLAKVGRPDPWRNLQAQWADVFDALENAPFDMQDVYRATVLERLLSEIRLKVGKIPRIVRWDPSLLDPKHSTLGPYFYVMTDLEHRFRFLERDTILFEYLSEDDAHDILSILALTNGRTRKTATAQKPHGVVPDLPRAVLDVAFAKEPVMIAYYGASKHADEYKNSFSLIGLIAPLPYALYHRLFGFATVLGAAVFAVVMAFDSLRRGQGVGLYGMGYIPYLIMTVILAFRARSLRINELAKLAGQLAETQTSRSESVARIANWGRPALAAAFLGLLAQLVVYVEICLYLSR
jgi:hypothetical protein